MPPKNDPLGMRQAVRCAADSPAFLGALEDLYATVDAEIARRGLSCRACGECCDFAAAGHRLYVTAGELALLLSIRPPQPLEPLRCAYQQNAACTARKRRPLGCRVHFCDALPPEDASELYEGWHGTIRRLHEEMQIPYDYGELTEAMRSI